MNFIKNEHKMQKEKRFRRSSTTSVISVCIITVKKILGMIKDKVD